MISAPFHTGIIVESLEPALDELGAAFGLEWASIRESATSVRTPDGRVEVEFRGTFSKPGPTRLEVIESVPGTLWCTDSSPRLHHVSFWSSDFEHDSQDLIGRGYPRVATAWSDDGAPTLFAYHQRGAGPYMELLDERERSHYEEWWDEA